MIKTAEIDRFENFACAKPAGGAKVAFSLTAIFHAIVFGALAAISINLGPAPIESAEVEASFTPEPPAPIDLSALELTTKQAPQLSDAATELQLLELPPAAIEIEVPSVDQPPIQMEPTKFARDLIPVKEKPKPKRTTSIPPTNKPSGKNATPSQKPKPEPAVFAQATVRSTARPNYPDSARRKGQQGTASVSLTLDAAGKVTAATISKSSGNAALDAAAVKAAKRWKFKPATSGGRPVSSKVVVPITFKLE